MTTYYIESIATAPGVATPIKVPLKDLRSRSKGKWTEVFVLDREPKNGEHDDDWDKARPVAKFTDPEEAWNYALLRAAGQGCYCAGVLIR